MICHVKIHYGQKNQGCTPFTGLVLLKFHSECIGKYCGKIENFLNTLRWCTTLAFWTKIGHVKIHYGQKNQDCTPFTGLVFTKILF